MTPATLTPWKQDGELHFAHAEYGHWMIEQLRGRFIVTLTIARTDQDMGTYSSLTLAKKAVERSHKIYVKQLA